MLNLIAMIKHWSNEGDIGRFDESDYRRPPPFDMTELRLIMENIVLVCLDTEFPFGHTGKEYESIPSECGLSILDLAECAADSTNH
ncbi:hypothetical protein LTS15_009614 [Exophiala xenobiotica]|nr:hypothetical protein LTS15_009614 [Exophiala xenobiotica]